MEREEWLPVAQFTGSDSDVEANLLLAWLHAEGITATRFPILPPAAILGPIADQPVVILVPADQREATEALIADYQGDTPE